VHEDEIELALFTNNLRQLFHSHADQNIYMWL
jgi:hypothetical protein